MLTSRHLPGFDIEGKELARRPLAVDRVWVYVLGYRRVPGIHSREPLIDHRIIVSGPSIRFGFVAPSAGVDQVKPFKPEIRKPVARPEVVDLPLKR